ncbi:hypothetical protein GIB67_002813 [Kingdonia uniflora]|uniref:isoleucine--tRNA ligase n=1 Tax=Kingdonia uniflora TaxID=39325 RepID=A0A7J7M562_9MAGN|nr:hypothetical protein GIB67_002813 [Kingdonia uniflora]
MEEVIEGKDFSFPKQEKNILTFWEETKAFETQLKLTENLPEFVFYDGPPFATGLPHYGHLLAGTIKDIVTRYQTMIGHHVTRRFGWDCHGLPIEFEIDKKLGIKTREQVFQMGIDNYNEECRSIVTRYVAEWESTVTRMGRWIDFKNDYKTMDIKFMESVWWVFSQLFDKGLVYRGFKVMPYSTGCKTSLSNFEANSNYKDVPDPDIMVSFPLVDDSHNASLVAFTTTPWTLPSNLCLCINAAFVYVKVRDTISGNVYVVAECRLSQLPSSTKNTEEAAPNGLLKDSKSLKSSNEKVKKKEAPGRYEVLEKFTGASLVGKKYVPLFDYFKEFSDVAFRVVSDNYVTDDSGTGIVHMAPAFGEEDYRVCLENQIINKGEDLIVAVDDDGCLTEKISDFKGRYVKDADKDIISYIKAKGRLVKHQTSVHSYPFCWRSETPLIYRAVPSWFVAVENLKEQLLENNKQTYWVPDFVKEKRFHNWLENARDWAVSRTRFWGTPLPIWISEDGKERIVMDSVSKLEKLSSAKVTDLHRHKIDHITIPSSRGPEFGVLRRVDDVTPPCLLPPLVSQFPKSRMFSRSSRVAFLVAEVTVGSFHVGKVFKVFGFGILAVGGPVTIGELGDVVVADEEAFVVAAEWGRDMFIVAWVGGLVGDEVGVVIVGAVVGREEEVAVIVVSGMKMGWLGKRGSGLGFFKLLVLVTQPAQVFDCWFESGSMPYAYIHYPFENVELFENNFPGHFVAEGLDQTRGWFYTLMVLSTALFGKPAFRNLICNGLVLASDGKKMSKRLQNYPAVTGIIDDYGADALRLYLINSPVVRAEPLRFKGEGVYAVVKDVFLPWYNAYRFLVQNAKRIEVEGFAPFVPMDRSTLQDSLNVLDHWINSATESLVHFVRQEMDAYRLYTVVPYLLKFIDNLTNIYVRFNRKRLKDSKREEDCRRALSTLYHVLLTTCKVMAPFTPFFTEVLYQNMRKACNGLEESIHYCSFPQAGGKRDERIEQSVGRMMTVIDLARNIRERHNKPLKAPLKEMVVVHPDASFLEDIAGKLKEYVLEELNIRSLVSCSDPLKYASLRAEPDFSVLGKRLGRAMGVVAKEVKAMSQEQILAFEKDGEVTVAGHCLKLTDIKVVHEFKRSSNVEEKDEDAAGDGDVLVILDLREDESLKEAGIAREVVNRVQKLRKKAGLEPTDLVEVYIEPINDVNRIVENVIKSQEAYITGVLGSPLLHFSVAPMHVVVFYEECYAGISGLPAFVIRLAQPALKFNEVHLLSLCSGNVDYADGLKMYLLSRDHSKLKSEFQLGQGKINVDCIVDQPAVDVVLGQHVFLTLGEYHLSTRR